MMEEITRVACRPDTFEADIVTSVLNEDDLNGLRESTRDVGDLGDRVREDLEARFQHAFEKADRVIHGSLEPLSA